MKLNSIKKHLFFVVFSSICQQAAGQFPERKNESPVLGGNWNCNPGFERVEFVCKKINLPENAKYYYGGNRWTCLRGYKKADNQCLKIMVPLNAKLTIAGYDWVCDEGYMSNGIRCLARIDEESR